MLLKFLKWFFISFGVFSFLLFLLSFTDVPFYAYYWLGNSSPKLTAKPDVIVVLGGAGMPSPDGLIRTYYASTVAEEYKDAEIIIALPFNEEDKDSLRQLQLMANELIVKGIDSSRIKYEPHGFNTRSQAVNIAKMLGPPTPQRGDSLTLVPLGRPRALANSVLLITSPEHLYRAVRTFKKAGFKNVGGVPAFEKPIDQEKAKDKENAKDKRVKSLALRYNMWSYLNYELLVMREYCAIVYYKVKGWI